MVKIPERTRNIAPLTTARADPGVFSQPFTAAQSVARELGAEANRQANIHNSEAQRQMAKIKVDLDERDRLAEADYLTNEQLKFQTEALQYMQEQQESGAADGSDYMQNINKFLSERANAIVAGAPSPEAAVKARGMLGAFQLRAGASAFEFAKKKRNDYYTHRTQETVNNLINQVRIDPNSLPMAEAQAFSTIETMLEQAGVPEEFRNRAIETAKDQISIARLQTLLKTDTTKAVSEILDGAHNDLPPNALGGMLEEGMRTLTKTNGELEKQKKLELALENVDGTGLYDPKSADDRKALNYRYNQGLQALPQDEEGNVDPEQIIAYTTDFVSNKPGMPSILQNQISAGVDSLDENVRMTYSTILHELTKDITSIKKLPPTMLKKAEEASLYLEMRDAGTDHEKSLKILEQMKLKEVFADDIKVLVSENVVKGETNSNMELNLEAIVDAMAGDSGYFGFFAKEGVEFKEDDIPQEVLDVFKVGMTESYVTYKNVEEARRAGVRAVMNRFTPTDARGFVEFRDDLPHTVKGNEGVANIIGAEELDNRFFKYLDDTTNKTQQMLNAGVDIEQVKEEYGIPKGVKNLIQLQDGMLIQLDFKKNDKTDETGQYDIRARAVLISVDEDGNKTAVMDPDTGNVEVGFDEFGLQVDPFNPLAFDEQFSIDERNAAWEEERNKFKEGVEAYNKGLTGKFHKWKRDIPGNIKLKLQKFFGKEELNDQ